MNDKNPQRQSEKKPTRGVKRTSQRRVPNEDNNSQDPKQAETNQAQLASKLTLKKYSPVYVTRIKEDTTCALCRNGLDQVCTRCQTQNITDTNQCPISRGVCGHAFHSHCLDPWLIKSPYCPGQCCLRWQNQ